MQIHELKSAEKPEYNRFVQQHALGSVHQLYEWGEFQSQTKQRELTSVFTLRDDKGKICGSALVLSQKLPFNKRWLYCPRGPLIDYTNPEAVKTTFDYLKQLAQKHNAVFLRFDPGFILNQPESPLHTTLKNFQNHVIGAKTAHAHYQPEHTLFIDLQGSEQEILAQMKPKGRYNIKVAQKHGVTIRVSAKPSEEVSIFYDLFKQTTTRDKFSGHPLSYYQTLTTTLGPERIKLYIAEYQGKPIAAAINTYFHETATYYFGASSNEHRNVMAPYLLHWQAMQDAKSAGCSTYDLFGIGPENDPNHPWASVTEFKLKFGGTRINYLPAQEIIYQPFWYFAIKAAKWLLSFKDFRK